MIKLLLVDDHTLIREGLATLLGTDPAIEVVGAATNGRDAVQLAIKLAPDVIVMDIMMPELNGIEATREILRRMPQPRIIILSMYSNLEHVHRAFAAGASGYVLKDAAFDEVISAVHAACSGRRYLSRALGPMPISATAGTRGPLDSLSARERQILQLVTEGRSSVEIGTALSLSPKTVDTYRSRLMKKLGVANVTELVRFALKHGVITPD